jgi:hypothetical protein
VVIKCCSSVEKGSVIPAASNALSAAPTAPSNTFSALPITSSPSVERASRSMLSMACSATTRERYRKLVLLVYRLADLRRET